MPTSKSARVSRRTSPAGLPALHLLQLAEVVAGMGVPSSTLFAGFGFRREQLGEADAKVPYEDAIAVVERAVQLTGDDVLGVTIGAHVPVVAFAELGLAAVTADTLRAGLEVMVRYMPTRVEALGAELHIGDGVASVVILERFDFLGARPVVLMACVGSLWNAVRVMTGQDVSCNADLSVAAPRSVRAFEALGVHARFERPTTQIVFDEALLALPLRMADPVSHRNALALCERRLREHGSRTDFYGSVQKLVLRPARGVRTLDDVAAELHVSPRTLKRRLAEHGVTYSEMLEEQQRRRAILLLQTTALSVPEIGGRLGYSDASNFSRAFQRWFGCRPTAFRLRSVTG